MNKESFKHQEHYSYEDLYALIRLLRSPEGCPWDRAQTHQSIRRGVIEEAYETAEAIDRADAAMMTEELGDLLMQVLFHICIGEEAGTFSAQDVYDRVCKKLIFRHPHVFGDAATAEGSTEEGWRKLKMQEKGQKSLEEELEGIAKTLPALTRAEKIAGRLFPKEQPDQLDSLLRAQAEAFSRSPDAQTLGDLLFTTARIAKTLKIDPEEALARKNAFLVENCDRKNTFFEKKA